MFLLAVSQYIEAAFDISVSLFYYVTEKCYIRIHFPLKDDRGKNLSSFFYPAEVIFVVCGHTSGFPLFYEDRTIEENVN